MAERADLTPAEILARQRMLEEALAGQDADAELFGAVNQVPPENYGPKTVRGIPEADENLLKTLVSPLVPLETDVVREPESTYTQIPEAFQNPADMGNPELLRTSYTPGRYANPRLAAPPIVDSISGGLKFGNKLLFGDAGEQAEAREKVSQGIGALPGLPKAMVESVIGGGRNVARGNITTQDAEGNITRPGQFAEGLAMFPAARAFSSVPEGTSFGVFGGRTGVEIGADVAEYERLVFQKGFPENIAATETGVFLGVDKQPRKFLGDFQIKNEFFDVKNKITMNPDADVLTAPLLSELVSFPGLEKNYPEIASAKVIINADPAFAVSRAQGANSYDPETNTFYLNTPADRPRPPFIEEEALNDLDYRFLKRDLGRLIQEAVQNTEGFAPPRKRSDYLNALSTPAIGFVKQELNPENDDAPITEQQVLDYVRNATDQIRINQGNLLTQLHENDPDPDFLKDPTSKYFDIIKPVMLAIEDVRVNNSQQLVEQPTVPVEISIELPELGISRGQALEMAKDGTLGTNLAGDLVSAIATLRLKYGNKDGKITKTSDWLASQGLTPEKIQAVVNDMSEAADVYEKVPSSYWREQGQLLNKKRMATTALTQLERNMERRPSAGQQEARLAGNLAVRSTNDYSRYIMPESVVDDVQMLDPSAAARMSLLAREKIAETEDFDSDPLTAVNLEASDLTVGDQGFKKALEKGTVQQELLAAEALSQGIELYDPKNPFIAKIPAVINNVPRKKGTPDQWMRDIRKQSTRDQVGIKEESFNLLNLQKELEFENERLKYKPYPGERGLDPDNFDDFFTRPPREKGLTREEVLAVFERQDRPVKIDVLSSKDSYTDYLLPGERGTARTFVFRSLPKDGDNDFYVEPHFDKNNPNEEKINTFAHTRVTSRKDVDDNKVFLAEEFQSEAFKPNKDEPSQINAEGIPLPHRSDWLNLSVERMLLAAAEEGFDTFAVPPGFVPHSMYNQGPTKQGYIDVYDKKIPALLKKIAKKYGMDYDDEISLPLENDRGSPLIIDNMDPEKQLTREAYINEELYNTPNREQAHISVRGLRITPEARKAILKAKVGRAQGGAVQRFNQGGMVSPMNKPRVTQGLTNLLNKYSTGPLAGAGNVSRETPVQPFNQGGAAQTYEEALKDPNRMNLAKRLGPEAWASSGIGNTPSQPLVNSLEYRNYGSNKNVPQGDFNPIVNRTFTLEQLSQRAADRGYGSVENLSKAEKAGLQLDQSPYFDSYETKSQMMNSPQGDQRYTNYDRGDYARGSGPKIMVDPVSSIPVTSIDYNVPGSGTSTGSGTISTGPVSTTPAYEDAPVAQTDNFEDNPVTSVPVVTPASTAPATADPVTSDLAVSTTPATTTSATTTPVAAAQPIVNPVTYPTAAVDPVVAPIDDTPLPLSVYNPPAPPEEAVYTPPAATVVDTPATLFTPPEVFDVPEAKEYQYLQDLRPDFDISDVIKTQTGGYAPTQGMVINPTEYQYSPDQVMSDNVYVPQIYRPMPQFTLSDIDATEGTTSEDSTAETDTEDTASTADTTQGTSFASLDSLSSNQQAYNPEQDYADRYGYTLAELRQINAERLRMGLPRLQDLQRDIGDINFSGGM